MIPVNNLATKISQLSLEQRKALEVLLKEKGISVSRSLIIPRQRSADGYVPLSFSQQRLWFLHQVEPESSAYSIHTALRLGGHFDVSSLERAITETVRRHEVLRTTFDVVDSQPVQIVSPQTALHIPLIDLSSLPAPANEQEARRLAALESQRPFDLRTGPLLRVSVIRLSASEHMALFTMHHIISDGWSMGILIKEVTTLYGAYSQGKELTLPELPIQYADFAAWQREWLQGEVLEEQLRYWKQQLGGAPPVLELPTDYPRPPVQSYRGAQKFILLPATLNESLRALAQKEGVSLFMLLLAALKVLLHRYSGQEDVVVGTFIANRNRPEIEGLVGVFINNLVLRTKVGGNPRFDELVKRVKEVGLGAYAHQDVPFEKVLDVLQPERDMSRAPLFQVIFGLQSAQQRDAVHDAGDEHGMRLSGVETLHVTARFDLEVDLWESFQGVGGVFRYNTDLFEQATIDRMSGHFQNLLENIVRTPSARLSELSMLSASERSLLLHDWNSTARSYPSDFCFQHLFEHQVRLYPDAPAALCHPYLLSYRELNRRANRLAHHLLRGGVERGETVAVLAMRGLDLLTAMIAIFKAGAAYLPLDPFYPPQRLRHVVKHSDCRRLLVTQELLPSLNEAISDQSALIISDISGAIAATDAEQNPAVECTPQDLAYIIYTSGSTGAPKGAMIEHRGMLNHLFAKINDLELTDRDVVAQNASQCFDISVWQMLAALLAGGRVQILDDGVAHDPGRMLEVVECEGVTVLEIVPSLLRTMLEEVLVEEHDRPELGVLRWLVVTGEALEPELCRRWLEVYEHVRMMNAYGPTECSDDVTHYEVKGRVGQGELRTPIGRAVQNTRMYVLDKWGEPSGVGVIGELYVGGDGVGRGYMKDSVQTAERFVPDGYGEERGGRLYRTGDVGRYRGDGEIEFLGRVDHQVKVRGYRIEVGEIEAVLREQEGVREAVVLLREDVPGDKRLVAYVVQLHSAQPPDSHSVPRQEQAAQGHAGLEESVGGGVSEASGGTGREEEEKSQNGYANNPMQGAFARRVVPELRERLRERLPEYMVPQSFVLLEEMPLTRNGKIDRQGLPAPEQNRTEGEKGYEAPRNSTEEKLASIWAEVLSLEKIGVHDNFFELGGDSIHCIKVVSRASKAGLPLTLKQVLQYQTIARLCELGLKEKPSRAEQEEVSGALPLMPLQYQFFERRMANPHQWNTAILLEVEIVLEPALLRQALGHLIRHHDALRMRFKQEAGGDEWSARIIEPGAAACPFSLVDLSALPEEQQSSTVESLSATLQQSLHLTDGPIIRLIKFDLGAGRNERLLLITHHLVSDVISGPILMEDIHTAYLQLVQKQEVALPEKTTSIKQLAERMYEHAQTEALQELPYWLELSRKEMNRMPLDDPDGINTEEFGRSVEIALSSEETKILLQRVAGDSSTQIMDVLLAALVQAYGEWTGRRALFVNLMLHGRDISFDELDISRTVGWLSTFVPLYLNLEGDAKRSDDLRRVGEELRRLPRHGRGYGELRYLNRNPDVRRQMKSIPEPEILFNYSGHIGDSNEEEDSRSIIRQAREYVAKRLGPQNERPSRLRWRGYIRDGKLNILFGYSEKVHRESTIARFAQFYLEALRSYSDIHVAEPVDANPNETMSAGDYVAARVEKSSSGAEQEEASGALPLTPLQYQFFERRVANPHHWNTAILLEVQVALEPILLRQALEHLIRHHDALRMRFEPQDGRDEWSARILEPEAAGCPFSLVDLSALPRDERKAAVRAVAKVIQTSLHLTDGPVLRLVMFNLGSSEPGRILFITHHLVSDAVTGAILLEDIQTAYRQLAQGEDVTLPTPAVTFREWLLQLKHYANSAVVAQELPYWLGLPWERVLPLPRDFPEGENTENEVQTVEIALNVEDTRSLVRSVSNGEKPQMMELLLTALVQVYKRWTGNSVLLVGVTGHGRDDVFGNLDLSGTVGWFNIISQTMLDLGHASTPLEELQTVKEQLSCIPHQGVGFGLLKCLCDDREIHDRLAPIPRSDILFNYRGVAVQATAEPATRPALIRTAWENTGRNIDPHNTRPCLLWWTGEIRRNKLHIYIAYNKQVFLRSTISKLAEWYMEALRSLSAHLNTVETVAPDHTGAASQKENMK